MNARWPSRAAARLRCAGCLLGCLWPRWCSRRRRARPLCVPVGGGPPASRPRCELRSARRLEARPGPATAHGHRSLAPRSLRCLPHQWRWGFCSIRRWLAACGRRVVPLMTPFPPFGVGQAPTGGGVAAKVQTHWVKNGEKGLFWLNGSAFWRIRRLTWCVAHRRPRYCEREPAISHVNPLFVAWAGLPTLVLAG